MYHNAGIIMDASFDIQSLRLRQWEIPDDQSNLDQLKHALQVVQAAIARGPYVEGSQDCGVLTEAEADAIIKSLCAKINRVVSNS